LGKRVVQAFLLGTVIYISYSTGSFFKGVEDFTLGKKVGRESMLVDVNAFLKTHKFSYTFTDTEKELTIIRKQRISEKVLQLRADFFEERNSYETSIKDPSTAF